MNDAEEVVLRDNPEEHRYELLIGGQVRGYIDYAS